MSLSSIAAQSANKKNKSSAFKDVYKKLILSKLGNIQAGQISIVSSGEEYVLGLIAVIKKYLSRYLRV